MELKIKVKQPGRKHPLIDNKLIEIEDIGVNPTARQLIKAVVAQQVNEYNGKPHEKNLLAFLSPSQTNEQAISGKISFGSIYNENKADVAKAQETALQAFDDGMFALFVNDDEITKLDQSILFANDTVITFIRLTFLAGSYW